MPSRQGPVLASRKGASRGRAAPSARSAESAMRRPVARAPHPADRDAVPAGVRRGDGLQRLLGHDAAAGRRLRQQRADQVRRSTARSAWWRCACWRATGWRKCTASRRRCCLSSFVLVLAAHIPHVGVSVNGARRWIGPGPLQFQPSELMKLALVLYVATLLAKRPQQVHDLRELAQAAAAGRRRGVPAGRSPSRTWARRW